MATTHGGRGGVWLPMVLVILAEIAILAFDPLGFSEAARTASARIADRIIAPFHGYDPQAEHGVADEAKLTTVVLVDDVALRKIGAPYPMPYPMQSDLISRILAFEPKAVFVDLLYAHDRGGLATFAELLRLEAAAQTGAGRAGLDPTGLLFAGGLGPHVEAHPAISDRFSLVDVEFDRLDPVYPLIGRRSGRPSAALALFRIACETPSAGPAPRGCADLEMLAASSGERALSLRYGSLSQDVWEPLGDLTSKTGAEFDAAAAALEDGCRHFSPDFAGRLHESARQALGALSPTARPDLAPRCASTLTVPAEELWIDRPEMRRYLDGVLRDKIVIIGSAVAAGHDAAPILGVFGPGVFRHATALDNLLLYGADHFRAPPSLDPWLPKAFQGLGLEADMFLEIGLLMLLLPLFFGIERGVGAWAGRRLLRRVLVDAAMLAAGLAVAAAGVWAASELLRWPPYGAAGAIGLAFVAARIVAPLRSGQAVRID